MNKQLLQNIDFYRQKLQTYYRLSPDVHKNLNRQLKPHLLSTCCALEEIPATQEDRILGLSKAYDYMVQTVQTELGEDTLLSLHSLLYADTDKGQAGQYRFDDLHVFRTAYTPPASEEIPHLIQHFFQQMDYSRKQFHPIEFASLSHKRILDICHFSHGNFCVAYLFLNLLLLRDGYGIALLPAFRCGEYFEAIKASQKPVFPEIDSLTELITVSVLEGEKLSCSLLPLS